MKTIPEISNKLSKPKYCSMLIPKKVNKETIMPAIKTPIDIKRKAFFFGILYKKATIDPVHAPVTGKGMATNNNKAK